MVTQATELMANSGVGGTCVPGTTSVSCNRERWMAAQREQATFGSSVAQAVLWLHPLQPQNIQFLIPLPSHHHNLAPQSLPLKASWPRGGSR